MRIWTGEKYADIWESSNKGRSFSLSKPAAKQEDEKITFTTLGLLLMSVLCCWTIQETPALAHQVETTGEADAAFAGNPTIERNEKRFGSVSNTSIGAVSSPKVEIKMSPAAAMGMVKAGKAQNASESYRAFGRKVGLFRSPPSTLFSKPHHILLTPHPHPISLAIPNFERK
jgi:hypothetical protein